MRHYHSARAIRVSTYTGRFIVATRDDGPALRTKKAARAECEQRAIDHPGEIFTIATCRFSVAECKESARREEARRKEFAR